MIDTNILISAALFTDSFVSKKIEYILSKYDIYLCKHILEEYWDIIDRKFSDLRSEAERFFDELVYTLVESPSNDKSHKYPKIRDPKDLPILQSAIDSDVDILLTGDKDLLAVDIDHPRILSIREFVEKY